MDITDRISKMKKLENRFNRTEFKVLFAIAVSEIALSESAITQRTGLGMGAVKDGLSGLLYHDAVLNSGGLYSYNDNPDTWKTNLLLKRNLGEPFYGFPQKSKAA